jgi:hypothetical protein
MSSATPLLGKFWLQFPARLPVTVALAVLCLSTVTQQSAVAVDNKAYPGSMCQPWGNALAPLIATDGGGVVNYSTTSLLTASCPVVRDNTTNTNGTPEVWVYVTRDATATSPLSCTLYSTRASDGATMYTRTDDTNLVGNVKLAIAFPSSATPGPYNLLCVLPQLSKIHAYLVPEY